MNCDYCDNDNVFEGQNCCECDGWFCPRCLTEDKQGNKICVECKKRENKELNP